MENIEEQINSIKQVLNGELDGVNKQFQELKQYNEQLHKIEDKTNDMQMGGVKISELTQSMGMLTKFLEGAFVEVNKSVQNINSSLDKTEEEVKK